MQWELISALKPPPASPPPQPSLHRACADTCASCLRAICPYKMLWERSPRTPLPNPALCKGKIQVWVKLHHCKSLTFGVHHTDHQIHSASLTAKMPVQELSLPTPYTSGRLGWVCCLPPVRAPLPKWQQPLSHHSSSAATLPQPTPRCSARLHLMKRV